MLRIWALFFLLNPDAALLRDVERSLARGDYKEAVERLSATQDRGAHWHLLASKAWDGLDDPARAVAEAERALQLEPGQLAYHLHLAQIFLSRNTPRGALEVFSEAEALFPDVFVIRLGKGLALKELQSYVEAERELLWCLARQPSSAIAFDTLATVYLHQLRFDDLRALALDFVSNNSGDYRGYYFLAAGRDGALMPDEETKRLISESISRNRSFAASHALMGKVLLRGEKPAEAAAYLKRAVELRPDLVQAHLHLARALRLQGDEAEASKHFQIVRRLKAKEQEPIQRLKYGRGDRRR